MYRVLVLLLFACSQYNQYPAWFTNVNTDNTKLYGVGSGISIEEAKKVAVSDIASQISISVNSRTFSTMRDDNRIGYEKNFIQDISNKVDDTIIPSYDVIKSDIISDGRFIVLISVEKNKLIEQYKNELSLIDGQVDNNYNSYLATNDILKKRLYLQHVILLSSKTRLLSSILSSLSAPVNAQTYVNNMLRYEEQMDKLMKQINFSVDGDDKEVKKIIEKNLNSIGFNVQSGQGNENTIKISFSTKESSHVIFDENIISLNITIQLKDNTGNIANTNIIDVNGSSIMSIDDSKRIAINNLDNKFATSGILTFLGLSS